MPSLHSECRFVPDNRRQSRQSFSFGSVSERASVSVLEPSGVRSRGPVLEPSGVRPLGYFVFGSSCFSS